MNNKSTATENYLSNPIKATRLAADRLLKTNILTLVLLMFIGVVIVGAAITAVALAAYANLQTDSTAQTGWVIGAGILIATVVGIILTVASDYTLVRSQNLHTVSLRPALARGTKRFWVALGAGILMVLLITVGLILLVIPGIYIGLRLAYTMAIVANEDLGPVESLKRSWELTKGDLWDIIGIIATVGAAVAIVNIVLYGLIHLLVGVGNAPQWLWIADLVVTVISIPLSAAFYFRYHQSDLRQAGKLQKTDTDSLNYLLVAPALVFGIILGSYSNYLNPVDTTYETDPILEDFYIDDQTI